MARDTEPHYSCGMYLRKQKKPNGRVYLSIVQSYRTVDGKPRSKTLRSLGYLDELEQDYPDPIGHFQLMIDQLNSVHMEEASTEESESVSFPPHAKIPLGHAKSVEAGAAIALAVLHRDMRLKAAIKAMEAQTARNGNLERTVELLVWNRIAHERLIEDAWAQRACLPGAESVSRESIFSGLSSLGANCAKGRECISETLRGGGLAPEGSWAYCFIINFYVEGVRYPKSDYNLNWENRSNPIIQLAVLTNSAGIPLDYNVFDSNLSTPLSSFPALQELAARHPNVRMIVVSDKAFGSNNYELGLLQDMGYGFILLQSMRKGSRASREWVLDAKDYTPLGDDGSRYKHRMDIRLAESGGKHAHPKSIAVKEVALWLRDAYESTRLNRFRNVRRNENAFSNGAPSGGSIRPMRALYGTGDAKRGEMGDHVWQVYWDKIAADESMDGYLDIITSELGISSLRIIELYRSLCSIRSFFAPMPGEWSACPSAVSRDSYLQAHFFICYLAACVVQLLYNRAGQLSTSESIRTTLASLTGLEIEAGKYFFNYRSRLSDKLSEAAGIDLSRPLVRASELSRMMRSVRK